MAHLLVETIYLFIRFGGPQIVVLGIVAASVAAIAARFRPVDRVGLFLALWAGSLMLAAPVSYLVAQSYQRWEYEAINERCVDFGCESDFYYGATAGMMAVATVLFAMLAVRRGRRRGRN